VDFGCRMRAASRQRLVVSFRTCCRCCPERSARTGTGPGGTTRQAGDQGCCGVEVRGFEPLASSVRDLHGHFFKELRGIEDWEDA
jgi:hypothetical protein